MIGFTELGKINDEVQQMEKQIENGELVEPDMASHVVTVMARGIIKHFTYPLNILLQQQRILISCLILCENVGALFENVRIKSNDI